MILGALVSLSGGHRNSLWFAECHDDSFYVSHLGLLPSRPAPARRDRRGPGRGTSGPGLGPASTYWATSYSVPSPRPGGRPPRVGAEVPVLFVTHRHERHHGPPLSGVQSNRVRETSQLPVAVWHDAPRWSPLRSPRNPSRTTAPARLRGTLTLYITLRDVPIPGERLRHLKDGGRCRQPAPFEETRASQRSIPR